MSEPAERDYLHDIELFLRAKSDPEAMDELVRGCGAFIEKTRQQHLSDSQLAQLGWDTEDAWQEAALAFVQAVRAFDPARGAPSTIAAAHIRNRLWMAWRKAKAAPKQSDVVRLDARIADEVDRTFHEVIPAADAEDTADDIEALRQCWAELTPLQRKVLRMYFHAEVDQPEIARRLGFSQGYISRVKNGALAHLRGRMVS